VKDFEIINGEMSWMVIIETSGFRY